jgi:hypothetical protein
MMRAASRQRLLRAVKGALGCVLNVSRPQLNKLLESHALTLSGQRRWSACRGIESGE